MTLALAELIVSASFGYAVAGLVVAGLFLVLGLDRLDPQARGAHAFRPLLLPGLALLWPLVLVRWMAGKGRPDGAHQQRRHGQAHRIAWLGLAVLLPTLLLTALVVRQDHASAEAPVLLVPPAGQP